MKQRGPVLILPGLNNSGPNHWQSHWGATYGYQRVLQDNWRTPKCSEWVQSLEAALKQLATPPVFVAHSTACALVAHWATAYQREVRGALLVAPSDTEAPTYPSGPTGFAPIPLARLPFPTIVVASINDPAVRLERAEFFAHNWGSDFVNIGPAGHIETKSGYGLWPEGHELVEKLLERKALGSRG